MLCEEDGRRDSDTEQRIYYFYGVLPASRHSELWQKCFMRKAGISNMTQSEESVTLMTFYRLPHQASGSFIFVQDDILPFSLLRQPILR